MTSSSVTTIVYYNGVITTTKHGSMFISGSSKIIELDNRMSLDELKQAIGNKISLPNDKVVVDIYFQCHVPFVSDCFQYRAAYCKMMKT
ncbi:hypothetical protein HKD37_19G053398 [Glycine soja]